ncbi:hypothetical protein D9M72_391240 [compost metagenome]
MQFWETIPLVLRRQRLWFKSWISEQYSFAAGIPSPAAELKNASDQSKVYRLLSTFAGKLPAPMKNLARHMRRRQIYKGHFLAFEGLVDSSELDVYLKKGHNIIGIYSDLFIKSKWQ